MQLYNSKLEEDEHAYDISEDIIRKLENLVSPIDSEIKTRSKT